MTEEWLVLLFVDDKLQYIMYPVKLVFPPNRACVKFFCCDCWSLKCEVWSSLISQTWSSSIVVIVSYFFPWMMYICSINCKFEYNSARCIFVNKWRIYIVWNKSLCICMFAWKKLKLCINTKIQQLNIM
jgi:hypothetical protein